jgi:hypothetical protein
MSLVISDVHGNLPKLKAFLAFKPSEEHIILGDILDTRNKTITDADIEECWNLMLSSGATFIWGNHELHYLFYPPFICSGYRHGNYTKLVEESKEKFGVALVRDNMLLTHAGVAPEMEMTEDINEQCQYMNDEFSRYLKDVPASPIMRTSRGDFSPIFNIGTIRGGTDRFGGIFWLDYRYELLSTKWNQVFGHCNSDLILTFDADHLHVAIDCKAWQCFDTASKKVFNFTEDGELFGI